MLILRSKFILVGLLILAGWLGLSFIKIKLHEDIVNKELSDLEVKASNLEKNNGDLEKYVSHMDNPDFLERQARILLNYKRPDEEVVFVYPDNNGKIESSSDDFEKQLEQEPNFIKWAYWLIETD